MQITSSAGYLWTDVWVLANVAQLATHSFCLRFLDRSSDPCGRQFDQMTQSARSIQANIAEGFSRRQTSMETEMKLLDVARASASELSSDFLFLLMSRGLEAWSQTDPRWEAVHSVALDKAAYSEDLMHDVSAHLLRQKEKFDPWIGSDDISVAANAMLVICGRLIRMLQKTIARCMDDFRDRGGFTEGLTRERLDRKAADAQKEGAPSCPVCGKPMLRRYVRKGSRTGSEFWGCSDWPRCSGTRDITASPPSPKPPSNAI